MSKFDNCYWSNYFAEYSMRLCNHPNNNEHHHDANCRGCKLFETRRQHRIKELKDKIIALKVELNDLQKKEDRKCQ